MELVLRVQLRCGSLSITTPVSLLVNEVDVRSILHGLVSLATVNQVCAEWLQKAKDSSIDCFENVNISILDARMQSGEWARSRSKMFTFDNVRFFFSPQLILHGREGARTSIQNF